MAVPFVGDQAVFQVMTRVSQEIAKGSTIALAPPLKLVAITYPEDDKAEAVVATVCDFSGMGLQDQGMILNHYLRVQQHLVETHMRGEEKKFMARQQLQGGIMLPPGAGLRG